MSDQEAHERTYTVFHEDGPLQMTEHELLNDYMKLREELQRITVDPARALSLVERGVVPSPASEPSS